MNFGAYYTPHYLVDCAYKLLKKHVNIKNYTLLDTACGGMEFLNLNHSKKIGADIDPNCNALKLNALANPKREKYGISENEPLIIVGNPPYNDKTSFIKQDIKSKNFNFEIDNDLKARDLGVSFLKSFVVLKPAFICVLHPLSYLIKETNFKALKQFKDNYTLLDAFVISSKHFTKSNEFPIVIALYQQGQMDYVDIRRFMFKTDHNTTLCLNDFDYIENYVDKYPNAKKVSECVGYFFPMRDINALKRNKTFLNAPSSNAVCISQDKLIYYQYIHHFKEITPKIPYYFGNLDIVIDNFAFLKIKDTFLKEKRVRLEYFKTLFKGHTCEFN
ncbi:adenine methyltransferase [Helicobacter cetorum]|uniref:adenine methyltransferase n=1 Tax=Helicobacter cetorum TaxID=138563 RepID=UPI000CF0CA11|nr:adenine methyltransferase [Helicobacter cetorum]